MSKPLFLIVNDDGVHAPGIKALTMAVESIADLIVVAPHVERSGAGQGLSLANPLRMERLAANIYAVDGTPTDCVLFALNKLMDRKPDWLLSGINRGANIGQDTLYSGTVAAATEGAIHGIPSIAFSLAARAFELNDYADAIKVVRLVIAEAAHLLADGPPGARLLNVNIPKLPLAAMKGVRVATLGRRVYDTQIVESQDPRGKPYFWVGGGGEAFDDRPGTDCNLLNEGYVTVTALQSDHTHHAANSRLTATAEGRLNQSMKSFGS